MPSKLFRDIDFDAVRSKNDARAGLGLFYTKDFDSFSEPFEPRRFAADSLGRSVATISKRPESS